jgi:hypothetical protein
MNCLVIDRGEDELIDITRGHQPTYVRCDDHRRGTERGSGDQGGAGRTRLGEDSGRFMTRCT